jgi:hypothetical protein
MSNSGYRKERYLGVGVRQLLTAAFHYKRIFISTEAGFMLAYGKQNFEYNYPQTYYLNIAEHSFSGRWSVLGLKLGWMIRS